ncbi:MAG TPA: hypothetical protein VGK21_17660, partial [Candidatus Angelobacter sp.]
ELTAHAAACGHCGPLLQEYQEDFSDDVTPEEQTALAQLRSASPAWQQQKAREMLKQVRTPVPRPSRRWTFSWRWALIPATAAVVAVAAITFPIYVTRHDTPEKVEKLLAQAYTEQRTMEMRIPYAEHADFKQTRSGESTSLLNSPEALRKATDKIAAELKKNPDNPTWLMLSARLDLLDWRYKSALSTLNKIDHDRVARMPELRMTQSLGLYEKAEIEHDQSSYGEMVELLGQTLQENPNDTVALFNQAIACERIQLYDCAAADYNRFLKIEKDAGWIAEARKNLTDIEGKKKPGR